jgi:hypothetical protein
MLAWPCLSPFASIFDEHVSLFACSTSRTKQAQARSSATPAVRTPVVAPPGKAGLENRRHGYRGVWQRKSGRWAAEIREPNSGKRHWVGTFGTAIDAALAYDRAAIAIIGSGAIVNFPSALPHTADAPVKCYPRLVPLPLLLPPSSVSMN